MTPHERQSYCYGRIYAIIAGLYPQLLGSPERMRACAGAPLLYTDEYVRLSLKSPRMFGALEHRIRELLRCQTDDYPISGISAALRRLWWLGYYLESGQTDRLSRARKARGFTQKQLGVALGYAASSGDKYVQRWENGSRPIPERLLSPLSELLRLDERYL